MIQNGVHGCIDDVRTGKSGTAKHHHVITSYFWIVYLVASQGGVLTGGFCQSGSGVVGLLALWKYRARPPIHEKLDGTWAEVNSILPMPQGMYSMATQ